MLRIERFKDCDKVTEYGFCYILNLHVASQKSEVQSSAKRVRINVLFSTVLNNLVLGYGVSAAVEHRSVVLMWMFEQHRNNSLVHRGTQEEISNREQFRTASNRAISVCLH